MYEISLLKNLNNIFNFQSNVIEMKIYFGYFVKFRRLNLLFKLFLKNYLLHV